MSTVNVQVDTALVRWLPVAFFGSVMGLTGLSLAWRLAHSVLGVPLWVSQSIGVVGILAFVAMVSGYAVKAITGFDYVKKEFLHPISGALFGTPLISALLLPAVLAEYSLPLARGLWVIGVVGMTAFAWHMASRWLGTSQQRAHATPAWMVPLVGMLDIPIAVPSLGFAQPPHAVMMLGLAVGLFFALPIFTMVFSRLMFEEPLPAPMSPSLMILLAPFAVGFSSYVITLGQIDALAEGLFALNVFLLLVLLTRLRNLASCCPFRVSWWAVSFPVAATAGAGLRYAAHAQTLWANGLAAVLLAFATAVVGGLFLRTLIGMAKGELEQLSS